MLKRDINHKPTTTDDHGALGIKCTRMRWVVIFFSSNSCRSKQQWITLRVWSNVRRRYVT